MPKCIRLAQLLIAALVCLSTHAQADVGSAYAYAQAFSAQLYSEDVGIYVLETELLNGYAPAPFYKSPESESFSFDHPLFHFSAEVVHYVSSTVDGGSGPGFTSAGASLTDLDFRFSSFLTFVASEAQVYTDVTGQDYPFSSSVMATGGTLTLFGNNVPLTQGVVYNQSGLHIVYGDWGASSVLGQTQSAAPLLSVSFNQFEYEGQVYEGLLSIGNVGSIQRAVPEPSSALVLGGLVLLVAMRRKRRTRPISERTPR